MALAHSYVAMVATHLDIVLWCWSSCYCALPVTFTRYLITRIPLFSPLSFLRHPCELSMMEASCNSVDVKGANSIRMWDVLLPNRPYTVNTRKLQGAWIGGPLMINGHEKFFSFLFRFHLPLRSKVIFGSLGR